ncbi:MAG: hypothetical protein ACE5EL_08520, partial [Anaerolineae bacterium]
MTNRSAVAMIAPAGVLALLLAACDDVAPIEMTTPPPEAATEIEPTQAVDVAASSVDGQPALGGKLYDKWWAALGADAPEGDHPLWATQSTNPRSGADTWRCKECHGWDYKGAEGAYRSGSHFTGFPGVYDAAQSQTAEELMPALKGATNPDHDFSSVLDDEALGNLAVFLSQALIDMGEIVDYEAKAPKEGDPEHGRELFDGLCAVCHGQDGRNVNFGTPEEPEYVATVAMENPQEFLHKDRFGQPGSRPLMPATIELGWSLNDIVDVLAYAQTLPTESAPPDPRAAGGRLYDKWWAALGVDEPEDDHPLWATQSTNARSGADTWRCKECHGWDYRGADGAYGSGSHFTGFP